MKRFLSLGILLFFLFLTVIGTVVLVSQKQNRPKERKYDLREERLVQLHRQVLLFIEAGKLREAEQQLRRILRIFPEDIVSQKILSKVFFLRKKFDQAEKLLRKLAVTHPQDPVVKNNLGMVLAENKFFESGMKELLEAEKLSADPGYIRFNLCHVFALLGRMDLAVKYWKEARNSAVSGFPGEAIVKLPEQNWSEKEK